MLGRVHLAVSRAAAGDNSRRMSSLLACPAGDGPNRRHTATATGMITEDPHTTIVEVIAQYITG
jgi:hypothetical protein